MKVHCTACGSNHTINANLAIALIESAQRGEMHTVGIEHVPGKRYTQVYPRCIMKMRHEIERHGNGERNVSPRPVAS